MRRTLTGLLALLLLTTSVAVTSADEATQEKQILAEGTAVIENPWPAYWSFTCVVESCPGLELTIELDDQTIHEEDPHFIEASFMLQGNLSYSVKVNSDVDSNHVFFWQTEGRENGVVSEGENDAIDNVPSPGIPSSTTAFDPLWLCPLNRCSEGVGSSSEYYSFIGALEDGSDKDSILINGSHGDVIEIPQVILHSGIEMEFWQRTDEQKSLLTGIEPGDLGVYRFEYPAEGELWLRLKQPTEQGFAVYQLFMVRFAAEMESERGELPNPWGDYPALDFPLGEPSYFGYISSYDTDGDSLLITAAPFMTVDFNCGSDPNIVYFDVYLHSGEGHLTNISLNSGFCPNSITTLANTSAIEIRMTSEFTARWSVDLTRIGEGDAGGLGDAPDILWQQGDELSDWPLVEFGEANSAVLFNEEYVDVFAFEVSDANGSQLYLDSPSSQPVFFQILVLNQTTGAIENSSQGIPINAPPGIHALRVERQGDLVTTPYDFTLIYQGEITEPEPPDFVDQSDLFLDYYIFVGVFLLAPAALAVFWNRKRWLGGVTEIEMEQHELRRLRRLRERLTAMLAEDETDEQVVDSALHQLGDSPWQAVVADWGEPLLRHNTEQVEICAWRISDGDATMLLGIRIADAPWELAAMRVHAPEGAEVSIGAVSPSHLFMGDEISLDTLAANSRTFLRLTLEGEPTSIGFHLSGLVDGEPLAAVPNRALDWS